MTAVLAFGLNSGAYVAEHRAGIMSVEIGQLRLVEALDLPMDRR